MKTTNRNFIKRFKKRKEDAFEYVIDEYIGIIKAIIYNSLGSYKDPQIIEECLNDTFLGAWEYAKQFEGNEEDFRKWICTIAKFKAVDKHRALARAHIATEIEEMPLEAVNSAEQEFFINKSTQELLKMMSRLGELDRDIFTMKYFLNMKNADIAEHLGLTKPAVDNRLYRGRKRLQEMRLGGSFA